MQADTESLLSLRDGEPLDAASLRRLAGCEASLREVQRLRDCRAALQSLPAFDPPGDAWAGIQARRAKVQTQSPPRAAATVPRLCWRKPAAWLPVAAALGLVALLWPLLAPERIAAPPPVGSPVAGTATHAQRLGADVTVRFAALQRQSREFDELLYALGDPPELVSAGTALTLTEIEGGIALIDDRLNQLGFDAVGDVERERVWEQRLALMNALLQLRLVQAQRYAF